MANTVVTSFNYKEDFHNLISAINPIRWKAFQVLFIYGENDRYYSTLKITHEQFEEFVARHADIKYMVPEDNEQMTDSYAMIDLKGGFFQNTKGRNRTSDPILKVGVDRAFSEMVFDFRRYDRREHDIDHGPRHEFLQECVSLKELLLTRWNVHGKLRQTEKEIKVWIDSMPGK